MTATAAAVAALAVGCGDNSQITGARVKGTVKYKGKVVTGGEIIFANPTDPNKSQSGRIEGDGTFDVPNVPVGDLVVQVDTEMAKYDVSGFTPPGPRGAGGGGGEANQNPYLKDAPPPSKPPMKFMPIDKKYAKADTTTLKMTVQKGTNEKDFELD